jgi:serine/threonine-protein kinase
MTDLLDRLKTALTDRYRIEQELGSGGMATVYLADDLRHGRQVALKLLRPELGAVLGGERFLREIRIAAGLSHPHILPLHDSGQVEGLFFYVMPYVPGESLRQKLDRQTQLSIEEAIELARQVASALDYAHRERVIHRDIKPENILLQEGQAVVADFGIARALREAGGERLTETGLSLGTPQYMSPEQASGGQELDARTDIYALAAVLYEMLAGEPPFTGPTGQAVIARQLVDPPPSLRTVRPTVPEELERAIEKALAKVPADRYETAGAFVEAAGAGAEIKVVPTRERRAPRRGLSRMWRAGLPVAALALTVAGVGMLLLRDGGPGPMIPASYQQLTYDGNVGLPALSPDAQYLAYVVYGSPNKIMVQDLLGGTALVVADSIGFVAGPRWSPDGIRLGFGGEYQGEWGVYVLPRLGGAPRFVQRRQYFAWSPDGTRIATWRQPREFSINIRNLTSGETDSLVIPGADDWVGSSGDWSPREELLALITYSADRSSNLWVLDLADGTHVLALADSMTMSAPRWAPSGDAIYYMQDDDLYGIAVDPRSGRVRGAPRRIVTLDGARSPAYTLSGDGRKLAYTRVSGYTNFSIARAVADDSTEQVTLTTGTEERGCTTIFSEFNATLSPDGTVLAFLQESADGADVYTVGTSGGTPQRLTFGGSVASICPAWGPSGEELAFAIQVGGTRKLAVIAASGGTPRLFENTRVSEEIAWAPSPRIGYQALGNRNFRLLDPETEEEQLLVQNDSVGWIFHPKFSPDGTQVAVFWNRRERGVWLISLVDSTQVRLVEGWVDLFGWSSDGQSVYTRVRGDSVYKRVPLAGGEAVVVQQPEVHDESCTPHERSGGVVWVCSEVESFSDVWMIENFDPEMAARSR